jgi:hypothetical protein
MDRTGHDQLMPGNLPLMKSLMLMLHVLLWFGFVGTIVSALVIWGYVE